MERTDVLELMSTLKLYGMRAAYDEVMAHRHQAPARDTRASSAICSRARSLRSRRARSNINWTIAKLAAWPRTLTTSTSPAPPDQRGALPRAG